MEQSSDPTGIPVPTWTKFIHNGTRASCFLAGFKSILGGGGYERWVQYSHLSLAVWTAPTSQVLKSLASCTSNKNWHPLGILEGQEGHFFQLCFSIDEGDRQALVILVGERPTASPTTWIVYCRMHAASYGTGAGETTQPRKVMKTCFYLPPCELPSLGPMPAI